MKQSLSIGAAVLAAVLVAAPQVSFARGHGGHYYGGGVPWWWIVPPLALMATLPYQTYDPQPVIVQQPAPPMVIVQPPAGPQAAMQQLPQYWYYCEAPKGYYPYVTACPGGWRPVSPVPPGVPH